jgi:hypothetical protein
MTKLDRNVTLEAKPGETRSRLLAEAILAAPFSNAAIAQESAEWMAEGMSLQDAIGVLSKMAGRVKTGDLTDADVMLSGQAAALNQIFAECAHRARNNMGHFPETAERYMRLALKAQSQCRTTWETLALMKNPTPTVYTRQANFAGQQQVNNAAPAPRAGENGNAPNRLLEASDGERLEPGKAGAAGATHPELEPVGALDRAANGAR